MKANNKAKMRWHGKRRKSRREVAVRSRLCGGGLAVLLGLIRKWSTTLTLVLTLASSTVATSLLLAEATSTCNPLLAVGVVLLPAVMCLPILRVALLNGLLRWSIGDWTWDILRAFVYIEVFVNRWRYWLNLCSQLLFDLIQVEAIFPIDQIDRQTKMTKSA